MSRDNLPATPSSYSALLRQCIRHRDLLHGRALHRHLSNLPPSPISPTPSSSFTPNAACASDLIGREGGGGGGGWRGGGEGAAVEEVAVADALAEEGEAGRLSRDMQSRTIRASWRRAEEAREGVEHGPKPGLDPFESEPADLSSTHQANSARAGLGRLAKKIVRRLGPVPGLGVDFTGWTYTA
ncbi:hypothetical protein QJS04_geneDACA001989 [Acorus gramineus]|uniref:Uncharacterized protein n=1 Tax=Acorus gramineus TaxID=55184 RepID=A0AAV9AAS5_ACOGR|nr:hypothetical protein QJS04_geneDACA001989 [Acorus gramineus]